MNAVLSAAMIGIYASWIAPPSAPKLAVLDVAELYRLKESQVAALLVKPDATDAGRAAILKSVHGFGTEVTRLLQVLPEECRCLILARGALIGQDMQLPDLTPDARRRLGL
jgi:hypothetical protein